MSPLVRMLLALACLVLLHATTANKVCFNKTIGTCLDCPAMKHELKPFFVTAGLSTPVNIPNVCKKRRLSTLLSETVEVCNEKGYELEVLPPVKDFDSIFSPLTVNCDIVSDNGYRLPCYHTEYELEVRVTQRCSIYY